MTTVVRRPLVLVSLLVPLVLVAPVTAPAASKHRHSRGHKARRHRKRRRARTKVKCAATLVCPSHPGAGGGPGINGANGAPGTNGTNGTNGANGSSMATRARSAGPITTAPCSGTCPDQNDPLNNNTWTQQANEADHFVAWTNITAPSTCSGSGEVQIYLDGAVLSTRFVSPGAGTQTYQFFFSNTADLPETGTASAHTLTAKASDTCTGGSDGHFTINSVAIDVERFA